MVLPGVLAVGLALGALLLGRKTKGNAAGGGGTGSRKRKRCDPWGALVDRVVVLPSPSTSDGTHPRSLEGLRYVVKDVFQITGRVAGFGSPAWLESHRKPASANARAIYLLQNAGATGVGVTHMDEFAYSISGENFHYGAPINPASPGRVPGGSSSGSAVAVAAAVDKCDFALGTDSGGSVRIPAAHCGVFGFRPTHGAVSATGVIKFAKSLDTVGWFARDASVLQQVGDVLLQPRLGNRGGPEGAHQELPKKLFVLEDVIDLCDTKAQCGVAAVCSALETEFPHGTISRLDLGQHLLLLCPTLREVQTRDGGSGLDALRVCLANIMGREVWQALGTWYAARPFSEDGDTGPGVRERMQLASKITEEQFTICTKARAEVKVALGVLLDGDSDAALVFPTAPSAAPFLESDETTQIAWRKKTLAVTSICSLTGFPQVTVPLTDDNPNDGPRGVSLVMGPGRDYALLRAARAFSEKIIATYPEIVRAETKRSPIVRDAERVGVSSGTTPSETSGTTPNAKRAPARGDTLGEPLKRKGNDLFKSGDFAGAVAAYANAIDAADKFASSNWKSIVLSNKAMAHLKLGAYASAEEDCTEALTLNSKNVKAYLRRGASRSVSGNYLEALEDFERALMLEPKNEDAKTEITRMKNILGDAQQIPDFD